MIIHLYYFILQVDSCVVVAVIRHSGPKFLNLKPKHFYISFFRDRQTLNAVPKDLS